MNTITIHNNQWNIFYFNEDELKDTNESTDFLYGKTVTSSLTIYIRKGLAKSVLKSVITREISKAFMFSYAIPISNMYDISNAMIADIACEFMACYGNEIMKATDDILRMCNNDEITIANTGIYKLKNKIDPNVNEKLNSIWNDAAEE